MALPNASVQKTPNSQARPVAGNDNYCGLVFYGNVAITGLTLASNKRLLRSPLDADNIGIDYSYSDETKATCTLTCSATGGDGDIASFKITDFSGTTELGTYVKTTAITTPTLAATATAAAINALSYKHRYTAVSAAAIVTITAPSGKGVALNTLSIDVTATGTASFNRTVFTGGISSVKAAWRYHIDMTFSKNPNAYLHVGVYPVPSVNDFVEVENLALHYNGQLKRIGVYAENLTIITKANLEALQTVVNRCATNDMPFSCLYTANLRSVTDLNTMLNLNTVIAPSVMVVISSDASPQSKGWELHNTYNKSISDLGAFLGMKSRGKVSNAISNVGLFNFSDGVNNEVLMFSNGQLYQNTTTPQLELLDDYRYTYLRKFSATERLTGSYANRDNNAVNISNEYNRLFLVDTYNKASRILREAYLEALSQDVFINPSNGEIQEWQVKSLIDIGENALDSMVIAGEISGRRVKIDPAQDIRTTNILYIDVELVQVGIAEDIKIRLGFVPSIA